MFDLEKAIAEWRREMITAGIKVPELLDELESHLREEIEQQMGLGASAEEAFHAAAKSLGQPGELGKEFTKGVAIRRPLPLWCLRMFCFLGSALVLLSGVWAFLDPGMNPIQRALGLCATLVTGAYLGALPFAYRLLPGAHRAGVRKAIAIGSVLMNLWIIAGLLASAQIIHVQTGFTFEMLCWWLVGAFAATMLAYASDRPDSAPDQTLAAHLASGAFTPIAQRSLEIARAEACGFYHDFIGTEHLLLGVVGAEQGPVASVLKAMGVERQAIRTEIEKVVGVGSEHPLPRAIPYTPRSRKALELAAREAKALSQSHISTEHVFLGLVLEGSGVAAKVLKNLGVDAERAREEVRKRIGPEAG